MALEISAAFWHDKIAMLEICPSPSECLELMAQHQMLPNIREHSLRVTVVALRLGEALVQSGFSLNLPLLEAGALLHDIAKTTCLQNGGDHAQIGAGWLQNYGYPAVAEIIRQHVYLPDQVLESPRIRETEVVNYADKRVMHTQVVSLKTRFADLLVRYGRNAPARQRITAIERRTVRLEDKIFAPLSLTPPDLIELNDLRRAV
ncbi:MAG: HD domain-containing protein [Desulfobacca sp.]|nr:HD domain-containing protein [Desulfobacca sp.]